MLPYRLAGHFLDHPAALKLDYIVTHSLESTSERIRHKSTAIPSSFYPLLFDPGYFKNSEKKLKTITMLIFT